MPSVTLGAGVEVVIDNATPVLTMDPPGTPTAILVPVAGPPGPPGNAGSAWSYHQTSPSANWILTHNLGIYPVPIVLLDDNPDRPVWTDVDYTDADSFTLTFPAPVTGWVHIH